MVVFFKISSHCVLEFQLILRSLIRRHKYLCYAWDVNKNMLLWPNGRNRSWTAFLFEVSRSPAIRHTHTHPQAGLLWTSDQLVAKAATYTSHNVSNRSTSVPSAGLEPAIPFATATNAKRSLGMSSPSCILELSTPVRIDMAVESTTIYYNIEGVSVYTNVSANYPDHYQQTM
jgi:hypothetical protein